MLVFGMALASRIGKAKVANDGDHTDVVAAAGCDRLGARVPGHAGADRPATVSATPSSGAAAIAPEVLEFFIGIGVPVYELYGMTENSAVATANFVGRMKLGTVGEPYPGHRIPDRRGHR